MASSPSATMPSWHTDNYDYLGEGETATIEFTYKVGDRFETTTATGTITVIGSNDGPVGVYDTATLDEDSDTVIIDVMANDTDADGDPLTISAATLPDGAGGTVEISDDGTTISFTPDDSYDSLAVDESTDVIITYTIEDGHGGTDTAEVTVTVTGSNDGPVAIAATASVDEDGPAVTGQLIATDIDGDELSYSLVGDDIPGLTINTDGTYSFDPGDNYDYLGEGETATIEFTYKVGDRFETTTATGTITVTGSNDGPVAIDDTSSVDEDGSVNVNVLTNDINSANPGQGGGGLTVTDATLPESVGGSIIIRGQGTIRFSPDSSYDDLAPGEFRVVEITYTVEDGDGNTDTAILTITVTGSNDGPVATDDTATLDEDSDTVIIDVLGNDTDPEGDVLTVTAVGDAEHGTVSLDPVTGLVSYTPDPDYSGRDSFTYEISDPGGATSTTIVNLTIDPANDDPVAIDDSASVDEDGIVVIDVLGNDTDADGDVLTISAATLPAGAGGTVEINDDGTISFTPDDSYDSLAVGETTEVIVTYTIKDGQGGTDTAEATITVTGSLDDVGRLSGNERLCGEENRSSTFSDNELLNYGVIIGGAGGDLTIFGTVDRSDHFPIGLGWADIVQLDDSPDDFVVSGGWVVQVDGNVEIAHAAGSLGFADDAVGANSPSVTGNWAFED